MLSTRLDSIGRAHLAGMAGKQGSELFNFGHSLGLEGYFLLMQLDQTDIIERAIDGRCERWEARLGLHSQRCGKLIKGAVGLDLALEQQ